MHFVLTLPISEDFHISRLLATRPCHVINQCVQIIIAVGVLFGSPIYANNAVGYECNVTMLDPRAFVLLLIISDNPRQSIIFKTFFQLRFSIDVCMWHKNECILFKLN